MEGNGKVALGKVALGFVAGLLIAWIIWGALNGFWLGDIHLRPEARWSVALVTMNDTCSRVGDFCERVLCDVANVGEGDGAAMVQATLIPVGRTASQNIFDRINPTALTTARRTQSLYLTAGNRQTLTFDFPGGDSGIQYRADCTVQP